MMTKRQFNLIADAVRASQISDEAKREVTKELGRRLVSENPLFNEDRFYEACLGREQADILLDERYGAA